MNPLKQQIARIAQATKRYLTADLQLQLENNMEKQNRTAQENRAAIQSLAVRIDDDSKSISHYTVRKSALYDSTLHAGQILELNTQIARFLPLWQDCESILACPLTLSACKALLPGKTILHDANAKGLLSLVGGSKVKTIGIVSPWLFHKILKIPHGLHTLLQACSNNLLFIVDTEFHQDLADLRRRMHRVGFYNVAAITINGTEDFISTGCLATGEYLLAGSEPAMPQFTCRWPIHSAARAPDISAPEQRWNNIVPGPFLHCSRGIIADVNSFAMAISAATLPERNNQVRISCTMSWSNNSLADHASLIGSYHGPGDTQMYACMLQLPQENNAIVSLWINQGTWRRLNATAVPTEKITSVDGVSNLPIWLEITPSQISIGTDDFVLIDAKDNTIKRTPYVGVRASGSTIAISNIQCAASNPCR